MGDTASMAVEPRLFLGPAAAITGKASGAGGNGGAVAGGTLLRGILEVCFGRFHW